LQTKGTNWGIIGAGFIAGKFINAANKYTKSTVVAVASRDRKKAEEFAARNGVPQIRVGYEALVEDPEIDAIYVATPHSFHKEHALLAISAGKPVLVEKPFTRNEQEGQEVVNRAKNSGVFAMEAMWSLFLPHMVAIRSVLARGELGEIVHVHADHGQFVPFDPEHRIYNRDLAGGALLDLGVYPISFVHNILGVPETITSVGVMTETNVDGQVSIIFQYPGRTQATVYSTMWGLTSISARITGTEGRLEVNGPFLRPTSFSVTRRDGTCWNFNAEVQNGFQYEIAEVARCVRAGKIESQLLPHSFTLGVARSMDGIRRQIGLVYPGENIK
jgi:predicted dehydrogenase